MLFERILYPIDFEKHSLEAKPYILKLKEAGCKEVHILYVLLPSEWGLLPHEEYDTLEKVEGLKSALSEGYSDALVKRFKEMLELAKEFEENGIKTRVVMIPGELDEVISTYADKHDIKLVALGINAASLSILRVGKILDILRATKQPILIVKSESEE